MLHNQGWSMDALTIGEDARSDVTTAKSSSLAASVMMKSNTSRKEI